MKCTLEQLREEATFRRHELGNVPLSKAQLVEMLGDGSASSKAAALDAAMNKTGSRRTSTLPVGITRPAATTAASAAITATQKAPSKAPAVGGAKVKKAKPVVPLRPTLMARKGVYKCAPPQGANPQGTKVASAKKEAMLKAKASPNAVPSNFFPQDNNGKTKQPPTSGLRLLYGMEDPPTKKSKVTMATLKPQPLNQPSSDVSVTASTSTTAGAAATKCSRVTKKLTLAQLHAEFEARKHHPATALLGANPMPPTKADLLRLLVEGTTLVSETVQYREYHTLLKKVEQEKEQLVRQPVTIKREKENVQLHHDHLEERFLPDAPRSSTHRHDHHNNTVVDDESSNSIKSSPSHPYNHHCDTFFYC